MLVTIFHTVISITAFFVMKKPGKKAEKKAEPDHGNTDVFSMAGAHIMTRRQK
jgi:hypothetical protein